MEEMRVSVRTGSRRGSIAVAAVLFLFFVLLIGALSVDMARYFYVQEQNQNVADGATLAAANAYDQVRTLDDLNEGEVVEAGFRYLRQKEGYDDDVYELSASLKKGDVITDRFGGHDDPVGADTVIRVGLNVKHSFEPYFLPREVFGDEYFTVQSQAVAEMRPVYSKSNLYDPHEPGPAKPALRYGILSDNIKPEKMSCFIMRGPMHANDGYVKIENMTGDGCSTGNNESVIIEGNLEAGNVSGGPGHGEVILQNIDGTVDGAAIWEEDFRNSSAPDPSEGDRKGDVGNVEIPTPPTPGEASSEYPGPICEFTGQYSIAGSADLRDSDGDDCSKGGTIFVKYQGNPGDANYDQGNLTIRDFNMQGEYSIVADGNVKFANNNNLNSNDMFVYSVNGNIKLENITEAEINATMFAPNGTFKSETSDRITINGGIVTGTMSKLETSQYLEVNFKDNRDLLPESLRTITRNNDVPDYWKVHLIE